MSISQHPHSLALATALCAAFASIATPARSDARPYTIVAQTQTPSTQTAPRGSNATPGGVTEDIVDDDMMDPGRMGMGRSLMGHRIDGWGGRGMGMMPMSRTARMKVIFAIIDTNGDGALSFDEIAAVHKRVFDVVDANKDGKVTMEELQAFTHQE